MDPGIISIPTTNILKYLDRLKLQFGQTHIQIYEEIRNPEDFNYYEGEPLITVDKMYEEYDSDTGEYIPTTALFNIILGIYRGNNANPAISREQARAEIVKQFRFIGFCRANVLYDAKTPFLSQNPQCIVRGVVESFNPGPFDIKQGSMVFVTAPLLDFKPQNHSRYKKNKSMARQTAIYITMDKLFEEPTPPTHDYGAELGIERIAGFIIDCVIYIFFCLHVYGVLLYHSRAAADDPARAALNRTGLFNIAHDLIVRWYYIPYRAGYNIYTAAITIPEIAKIGGAGAGAPALMNDVIAFPADLAGFDLAAAPPVPTHEDFFERAFHFKAYTGLNENDILEVIQQLHTAFMPSITQVKKVFMEKNVNTTSFFRAIQIILKRLTAGMYTYTLSVINSLQNKFVGVSLNDSKAGYGISLDVGTRIYNQYTRLASSIRNRLIAAIN